MGTRLLEGRLFLAPMNPQTEILKKKRKINYKNIYDERLKKIDEIPTL